MTTKNRLARWLASGAALTAMAAGGAGCLSRPVGVQPPTTKVNFTSTVSQQAVDKVDLLFAIDNSSSMGDKQAILADAVPDLIQGLLKPKCVNPADGVANGKQADPTKEKTEQYGCPAGSEPEFKPVTDMHIGIISSSLGSFGGDVCPDTGRFNDHGRLLNYVKGGGSVADAPGGFLAWFPSVEDNRDPKRHPPPQKPITDIGAAGKGGLTDDFQKLVVGIEQNGCGLEAQLESVYHFLIQPDPWARITLDGKNQATYGTDVDVDVIQQRADFLRPDSLVAVIMLTDEDDSSADPLSVGGQGWAFMANQFPGSQVYRADGKTTTAPRATSACKTNPGSPDCTSCGFAATCDGNKPECQKIKNDPECKINNGYYGANEDDLNVRFHRMKERYGIDPQFPISRYVDGLTKAKVPDRKSEHPVGSNGAIGAYAPVLKCTNPLFASKLPAAAGDELCNLPRGTRSSDLIFFAVVGGVPNKLLHFDPNNPESSRLTNDDWSKILGANPAAYNYANIDPHMIQSVSPRQGLTPPSGTRGDNGDDPVHGREWDTQNVDLQYACTFELPKASQRVCNTGDSSCDCPDPTKSQKNPPLCTAPSTQSRAKAYPTVREFQVVRALGDNGIAASLCPIQLTDTSSPTYGYRPAVAAIVDRLKNALTTQCLPQQLTRDTANNEVPCLVLAQLPDVGDKCSAHPGLKDPPAEILQKFKEQQKEESGNVGDGGQDFSALTVCVIPQLKDPASNKAYDKGGSCKDITDIGWCYVENDAASGKNPAGRCPQALIFSTGSSTLPGARFSLQCIQQFAAGQAAGDTTTTP